MSGGWQKIETAPKDGTVFLAYSHPYWMLTFWSDKWNKFACYWDGDPPADEYAPRHWQPLPEPPSDLTERE